MLLAQGSLQYFACHRIVDSAWTFQSKSRNLQTIRNQRQYSLTVPTGHNCWIMSLSCVFWWSFLLLFLMPMLGLCLSSLQSLRISRGLCVGSVPRTWTLSRASGTEDKAEKTFLFGHWCMLVTLVDVGEGGSSCLQAMMLIFECLHQDMNNVEAHRAQLFLATWEASSSIHELNL